MSGLEGTAIAAAGGRLLGGLAVPAARALTRKMFFRWRVWWKVRKKVDFSCRWRTYRRWLKTLTAEELGTPVEEIHGPLAKRLDESLSAASNDWARSDDHLSSALRLVELTYPAIAAALGDGDRAELNPDEWVWKNVKADRIKRAVPMSQAEMKSMAIGALRRLQKLPHTVRGFFADPHLAYIRA